LTRLLIPLVAVVTLALFIVWLQQGNAPAGGTPPASQAGSVEDAASAEARDATPPAEAEPEAADDGRETADGHVAAAAGADEAEDQDVLDEPTPQAAVADAAATGEPASRLPDGFVALAPVVAERRLAFEAAGEVLEPDLDYAAVIETNRGAIVVELYERETPTTVNNFVFLALHRYFDGIVFHRVIDGFMAQTGDPTGTGTGGPGYRFDDEIVDDLRHDGPGVLSMANAGPGTNGSQFFLTFAATPWLDGAHTVFGRVTDGLEVLDEITRVDPQQPSIVALLADPVASLRDQGLEIEGDGTVEEALRAALGVTPVPGPGYEVAGARVIVGSVNGEPAAGFFPSPDRMERVTIVTRPHD